VIKDYYKLLQINSSATKEEIKLAYRKLAHKYHPDKTANDRFENKFKEINDAYRILADESKRKNYDQQFHYHSYSGNSSLILIYIFVLTAVFSCILWYLSHFSLTSF
jgi:DnaJ-class molecular chaperone